MGPVSPSTPDRKRVRFTTASPSPPPPPPAANTLRAVDVVQLRFVHSPADIAAPGAAAPHDPALTTRPPYLHQIIPKETIHGWRALVVAVYIHRPSLTYWIHTHGQPAADCAPHAEAGADPHRTDVPALLAPFIKAGLMPTREAFEDAIAQWRAPPLRACLTTYDKMGREYGVYKQTFFVEGEGGQVRDEAFLDYHRRMAFLMFVHIDGASFIDEDDPRWEVFVIVEEDAASKGRSFVGYATTYPFSVLAKQDDRTMSFADRIRVSQVFISPLHQGQGHGRKILGAVYKDAKARAAIEVTVEDPSRGFRILRDITDLKRCYEAGLLNAEKPFLLEEEASLLERLHADLLLTSGQARRCLEVHQLAFVDRDDEEAYKKYRLWVKRRLYKENYEVLDNFDKEERKTKLAEIYDDYEKEYQESLRRLRRKQQQKQQE